MGSWPRSRDDVLLLDEIAYEVYVRMREARDAVPKDAVTQARDVNGVLWRAVDLGDIGWRRVRIS